MPGPSRLRLTKVLHEGAIWDVYIATTPHSGGSNVTQLEFEASSADHGKLRHTRPVDGPLLDALLTGAPVSRARLGEELDLAFREAVAVRSGDAGTPTDAEPSGPAPDGPLNGR